MSKHKAYLATAALLTSLLLNNSIINADSTNNTNSGTPPTSSMQIPPSSSVKDNSSALDTTTRTETTTPQALTNITPTINDYDSHSDTFTVEAKGDSTTKTIKGFRVAIWSEENGNDDLKWFTVDRITNNSAQVKFNVKDFNYKPGNYIIHAYIDYTDGTTSGTNFGTRNISVYNPTIISDINNIMIRANRAIPAGVEGKVAIWSKANDQDDLKWYTIKPDGTLDIPLSELKGGMGDYNVHVYFNQDNQKVYGLASTVTINPVPQSLSISKKDNLTYDLILSNVPSYYKDINIPVWSEADGQDDLVWTAATKISSNQYKITINLRDHKYNLGKYNVGAYATNTMTGKTNQGLTSTTFETDKTFVGVDNYNGINGKFDVVASPVDNEKAVKAIRVAVWSQAMQENLFWYQVNEKSANGLFTAHVDVKNHKNIAGTYHVAVYVDHTDGSTTGYNLTDQQLSSVKLGVSYSGVNSYTFPEQYRGLLANPLPNGQTYPGNAYAPGQCTWYVYNRFAQLGINIYAYLGNANQWPSNALIQHYGIGKTPRVGAAVIFPKDGNGWGHVGFVEHVNADGSFLFSESNYNNALYQVHWRESWVTSDLIFIYP